MLQENDGRGEWQKNPIRKSVTQRVHHHYCWELRDELVLLAYKHA